MALCAPGKPSRVSHTAGVSRISYLRACRPAAPLDPASGSRTGGARRLAGTKTPSRRDGSPIRSPPRRRLHFPRLAAVLAVSQVGVPRVGVDAPAGPDRLTVPGRAP